MKKTRKVSPQKIVIIGSIISFFAIIVCAMCLGNNEARNSSEPVNELISPEMMLRREVTAHADELKLKVGDIAIDELSEKKHPEFGAKIEILGYKGAYQSLEEIEDNLRSLIIRIERSRNYYSDSDDLYGDYELKYESIEVIFEEHTYTLQSVSGGKYLPDRWFLYRDGELVDEDGLAEFNELKSSAGSSSSSSSGKEKCDWCNGTGMVKYYYGGSATEAFLNGHEDSWYGQCGSCQGTGYR